MKWPLCGQGEGKGGGGLSQGGGFADTLLKERKDPKDSACNSHDDKNPDKGAHHQENGPFHPSFFEKETDDAR